MGLWDDDIEQLDDIDIYPKGNVIILTPDD